MQVGGDLAVEDGDPAQLQLLADLGGQLLHGLVDGLVVELGGLQRLQVGAVGGLRGLHDAARQRDELVVLGDEVGLAVDLDHRAVLGGDQALGGRALGALADVLGALDAQRLDGLVEVPGVLLQGLLAVHHAGAGHLPETLDVGRGVVRHRAWSVLLRKCVHKRKAVRGPRRPARGRARI